MAKLIPPHQGATWCDIYGQHHTAGPDGAVEVPEIYVPTLIDAGWSRAPMAQAPAAPMPFIAPAQNQKDMLEKFNALLAQLQDKGLMAGS